MGKAVRVHHSRVHGAAFKVRGPLLLLEIEGRGLTLKNDQNSPYRARYCKHSIIFTKHERFLSIAANARPQTKVPSVWLSACQDVQR